MKLNNIKMDEYNIDNICNLLDELNDSIDITLYNLINLVKKNKIIYLFFKEFNKNNYFDLDLPIEIINILSKSNHTSFVSNNILMKIEYFVKNNNIYLK